MGRSRSLGFIPVGWKATSVRTSVDDKHILIANGKGATPKANRTDPNPCRYGATIDEYIGKLFQGPLSVIEKTDAKMLRRMTVRCTPLRACFERWN